MDRQQGFTLIELMVVS
ncbi:prepilin-type N-terminal cleavage/methylation domain-containing protein [Enterobacter kobei]